MCRILPRLLAAVIALATPFTLAAPAQAGERSAAAVLMYHRFGEDSLPATNIRLEQFRDHLRILATEGYAVLPLPEVVDALRTGRALPDKAVAITVDDAFASVYEQAWPLLREAGYPLTLFVSTQVVGAPGYMTWEQIRALAADGVTIGAHGHAHGHMPAQSPEAQAADMATALALLEQHLGHRPALFAYPYGETDSAALTLARDLGFAAAFGQHSGVATAGDLYYLPRFALNEHYGAVDRFRMVAAALPIPAADVLPENPALDGDDNPPRYGFTVTDAALTGRLDALNCFGPDGQPARTEILGPRVEVRLAAPLPPGRGRINCTLPGTGADKGRWHWRGMQFVTPGGED